MTQIGAFCVTFNRTQRWLTANLARAAIWRPDWVPVWAAVPAIAIIAWNFFAMRRVSDAAVTNAFGAQGRYKHFLHRAIWHSTTVTAVLLWLHSSLA